MLFSKKTNRIVFDINQGYVKLVYNKDKKVKTSIGFAIPDDIRGNEFQEDNLLHSRLSDFKKNNSIEDSTSVSLFGYGNLIQSRIVDLPLVSEAKLRSLIFWDLESHFNISPDEIYWDFKILSKSGGRCSVIIISIKRTLWDRISAIVNGAKLKFDGIDTPSSSFQNLIPYISTAKKCGVYIFFGKNIASLSFFNEDTLVFQREIPLSVGEDARQRFIERWEHTIAFFQANYKLFIENIMLTGEVPDFFNEGNENILGVAFKRIDRIPELNVAESTVIPHCACGFDGNPYMGSHRLTAKMDAKSKPDMKLNFSIPEFSESHYAGVLVLIFVLIFFGLRFDNLRLINKLKTRYLEYQKFLPVISKLEILKNQKKLLSTKEKLISDLESQGITNLPEIFEKISEDMPSGSWISSLNMKRDDDSNKLEIRGYCDNYENQMNFFSALKKVDIFNRVDVNEMHKSSIDNGLWNFSASIGVNKGAK